VSHPKQFRHLVSLALSLALIVAPSPVWACGDLGHRVICQIAFQELNDTARNEVIRLIALDPTFDSFTDACTWPDHPRKRAEEHFVNVPRSLQAIRVRVWQITSAGRRLPAGRPARQSVLMLPALFGVFESSYSVRLLFTRALVSKESPCIKPLELSY